MIDADQKKSETAHRFDCVVKQGWHLPPRNIKVIFPKWTSTLRSFAIPLGFPGSSAGKESACNVRDPGSIPGSEGSLGKGIGYPFQYSGLENSPDYIYSSRGRKESDTTQQLSLIVCLCGEAQKRHKGEEIDESEEIDEALGSSYQYENKD